MENVQKDLVRVLLEHIFSLGLISQDVYARAVDLACSTAAMPQLLTPPERRGPV